MVKSEQVLQSLITLCRNNEIIPPDLALNADDDLFDFGVIDSMGLIVLAVAIEEDYEVSVPQELLLAELRTPLAIANYIVHNSTKDFAIDQAETQV